MKYKSNIFIFLFLLIFGNMAFSQTVAPPYEVGTWYGFKPAAISFTFDDGCRNQFDVAIPMFNEFDYNLTLFTVTRSQGMGLPNWINLQSAASQGHEIAAHTLTHTSFAGMSDSLQTMELKECRDDIDSHITGQKCITMAYPFCVTGNKSLVEKYYLAARICSGAIEPKTPRDFMAISSIVCGTESSVNTSQSFISKANSAVKSKGWCVFLLHGIDNDGGWSPVSSTTLRETLELLKSNQNDYWVESFGNVVRYIIERNQVSVVESSVEDSTIFVQVADTLDNEIFNYPLTLKRPLPEGWQFASVVQNGQKMDVHLVNENETLFIVFDVVPDGGDVIIKRASSTGVVENKNKVVITPLLSKNYPNPFNPSTTIEYVLPRASFVTLKVYDLLGREFQTLVQEQQMAGVHSILFQAGHVPSNIYFYKLETNGGCEVRKMVLMR